MSSFMGFLRDKLTIPAGSVVDGIKEEELPPSAEEALEVAGARRAPSQPPPSPPPSEATLKEWQRRLCSKQYWMPDAVSHDCYGCQDKFNVVRRRHHCR